MPISQQPSYSANAPPASISNTEADDGILLFARSKCRINKLGISESLSPSIVANRTTAVKPQACRQYPKITKVLQAILVDGATVINEREKYVLARPADMTGELGLSAKSISTSHLDRKRRRHKKQSRKRRMENKLLRR